MLLKKIADIGIAIICLSALVLSNESTILKAGDLAPSFSLLSLNGDRENLRTYCGDTLLKPFVNNLRHTVIVSFWATYCAPCQKEIPELISFLKKHQSDTVKVFCISIDKEGSSIVEPFVKDKGYAIPILLDPYKKTSERYGVTSLPSLFVIDPFGKICYSSTGYDTTTSLQDKLEKILSDRRSGHIVERSGGTNGESVKIEDHTKNHVETTTSVHVRLTAKQRWEAIARVECGTPVSIVAESLHVTTGEIKKWFNELQNAAISLWKSDTALAKKQ